MLNLKSFNGPEGIFNNPAWGFRKGACPLLFEPLTVSLEGMRNRNLRLLDASKPAGGSGFAALSKLSYGPVRLLGKPRFL